MNDSEQVLIDLYIERYGLVLLEGTTEDIENGTPLRLQFITYYETGVWVVAHEFDEIENRTVRRAVERIVRVPSARIWSLYANLLRGYDTMPFRVTSSSELWFKFLVWEVQRPGWFAANACKHSTQKCKVLTSPTIVDVCIVNYPLDESKWVSRMIELKEERGSIVPGGAQGGLGNKLK